MKLFNYLLRPDVYVVFDIDGTLAAYKFGEFYHSGCEEDLWEEFVKTEKPYDTVPAIPLLQDFIHKKCEVNPNSVYVCSVSQEFERQNKKDFVLREYPEIPEQNIVFVDTKPEKLDLLRKLAKVSGSNRKVAIVDDTVKTLDLIYEQEKFVTVHISTFFLYDKDKKY